MVRFQAGVVVAHVQLHANRDRDRQHPSFGVRQMKSRLLHFRQKGVPGAVSALPASPWDPGAVCNL